MEDEGKGPGELGERGLESLEGVRHSALEKELRVVRQHLNAERLARANSQNREAVLRTQVKHLEQRLKTILETLEWMIRLARA